MEYKKIKPKKIYEEVTDAIVNMIKTEQLKPGDKLDSVQQLAENFQVGRSAIREALTALKAMGLIEMRQGEGTYIMEFDNEAVHSPLSSAILMNKEDLVNLLEVRKIIEIGTVANAARKRTSDDLHAMEEALKEMRQANGNEELGEQADLRFHLAIAEASNNPILTQLMSHVSGLIGEAMKETRRLWLFSQQTTVERLYEEHLLIFNAIKKQEVDEARKLMLKHIENVEEVLNKYI